MRGIALLAAASAGVAVLCMPLAALAAPKAQPAPLAPAPAPALPPAPSAATAAQVRAGVDAWTSGDYAAAVKSWQGPAARNDPDALFNLGQAYKLGRGVPKDLVRAEAYYGKAARLGHIAAADNYGIILFQTNRQQAAMPWLQAAADRGEPRAMYVLGIASYNGDFAPKDWVRAYALVTRAAASGLAQATASLATMNQTIPLEQRQMGVSLAGQLDQQAADARGRELASADLGAAPPAPVRPSPPQPAPPPPPAAGALETVDLPPSAPAQPAPADPAPANPAMAYLPPPSGAAPQPRSAPKPAAQKPPTSKPALPKPAPKPATESGAYRIQLGAFGVKANADALWARVRGRPEIAGHPRQDLSGAVTRVLATGFSQAGAERACTALKASSLACIVVAP